jgi:hypothetical protein
MIPEQTLSWTQAQSAARLRTFRAAFLIGLAGNAVIALWCLFDPVDFARALHQPDPVQVAWLRIFAAAWFGLMLVCLQGLANPLFFRWPVWSSIVINFLMAIVFGIGGRSFLPLAIWTFGVGIIVLIAYYRLILADICDKP